MLPNDFLWTPHTDGGALRYLHHMIALTSRGKQCCIAHVNPNLAVRRDKRLATESGARRYVEAWAVKWQEKIRGSHSSYVPPAPVPPYAGPEIRVVPERQRRRGGRNWVKRRLIHTIKNRGFTVGNREGG